MLHRKIIPAYSGNFREGNNRLCMISIVSLTAPTATNTFWSSAEQTFVAQQSSEITEPCAGSEIIVNNKVFFLEKYS
jgi:hypothetical protein